MLTNSNATHASIHLGCATWCWGRCVQYSFQLSGPETISHLSLSNPTSSVIEIPKFRIKSILLHNRDYKFEHGILYYRLNLIMWLPTLQSSGVLIHYYRMSTNLYIRHLILRPWGVIGENGVSRVLWTRLYVE